jgi:hypothetical protein
VVYVHRRVVVEKAVQRGRFFFCQKA